MVRLQKMEFFPLLGRSYVLGWDDGTWPCLPGGTWGSLHVLQAAQCPSSGSLPQCAASDAGAWINAGSLSCYIF